MFILIILETLPIGCDYFQDHCVSKVPVNRVWRRQLALPDLHSALQQLYLRDQ